MARMMKEYGLKDDELCDCSECKRRNCPHRDAFRRLPREKGGLGLCPNLDIGTADES